MNHEAAQVFEPCRKDLRVVSGLHHDRRLRGKLDLIDVDQRPIRPVYGSSWSALSPRSCVKGSKR